MLVFLPHQVLEGFLLRDSQSSIVRENDPFLWASPVVFHENVNIISDLIVTILTFKVLLIAFHIPSQSRTLGRGKFYCIV